MFPSTPFLQEPSLSSYSNMLQPPPPFCFLVRLFALKRPLARLVSKHDALKVFTLDFLHRFFSFVVFSIFSFYFTYLPLLPSLPPALPLPLPLTENPFFQTSFYLRTLAKERKKERAYWVSRRRKDITPLQDSGLWSLVLVHIL